MSRFHFLNVKNGDCSIIEHNTGHVSMIDVSNARLPENQKAMSTSEIIELTVDAALLAKETRAKKNYNQKAYPANPIEYLKEKNISSIFRLAITHPDMDHMDGLADLFEYDRPTNFYITHNEKSMSESFDGSPYREEDWLLYKQLRDNPPETDPKILQVFSGDHGIHRTKDWDGNAPGDAFYTLSPTKALVDQSIEADDYNDASYVFLWRSAGGRVLLCGDSHDKTWEHILENHKESVSDIDLLIAPHHGRKSGRNYDFLDTVNPKMTFFGNAPSKDLAYSAWRNRGLSYITNNMAGSMIVDCSDNMSLYVTNEAFARDQNEHTFYSEVDGGWYITEIAPSEP